MFCAQFVLNLCTMCVKIYDFTLIFRKFTKIKKRYNH
uniref:Uncharacterized protein n=1 Tax=Firmicutes phage HS18 TaxID=3056396 RepID=A0AA49X3L0_9VIRU|nr:MAG: hypothetical protein [Firmicutes phage HS18]